MKKKITIVLSFSIITIIVLAIMIAADNASHYYEEDYSYNQEYVKTELKAVIQTQLLPNIGDIVDLSQLSQYEPNQRSQVRFRPSYSYFSNLNIQEHLAQSSYASLEEEAAAIIAMKIAENEAEIVAYLIDWEELGLQTVEWSSFVYDTEDGVTIMHIFFDKYMEALQIAGEIYPNSPRVPWFFRIFSYPSHVEPGLYHIVFAQGVN